MITQEEHDKIVQEVIESVLLRMPEVIGNLMSHHAKMADVRQKLMQGNPEFNNHIKTVATVIEKIEGMDINLSPDEVIKKAIPEIKSILSLTEKLDFTSNLSITKEDKTAIGNPGEI